MKIGNGIAVCVAMSLVFLSGNGIRAGMRGTQDEQTHQQALEALQKELAASRDAQVQQLQAINALAVDAENAKQASHLAELRAAELLKLAQDQLTAVQQEATSQQAEADVKDSQSHQAIFTRLALAQSQHAALQDYLTQAQDEKDRAQAYYRSLKDAQANAALQDFVLSRASTAWAGAEQGQDFWIGVQCEPAEEVKLRFDAQSDRLVTVKGGLRVNAVTNDSPAQSAGVKEQDVILYMNDQPTNQIEELVAIIANNGENPATLYVIRDQQPMTFSITPLKRPIVEAQGYPLTMNVVPEYSQNMAWGAYVASTMPSLPSGFEANIHVAADAQPEIVIKSGDQSWTVNAENIESLPESVRKFAQSVCNAFSSQAKMYLQRPGMPIQLKMDLQNRYLPGSNPVAQQLALQRIYQAQVNPENADVNAKLEQLTKQIEELRATIERMQK